MNKKKKMSIKSTIIGLLNGSIITSDFVKRQIPFILLLLILGLVYISNGYHAEKVFRETEKTKTEIDDLRAEKVEVEYELMQRKRIKQVQDSLKSNGSKLKDSNKPAKKIPLYKK